MIKVGVIGPIDSVSFVSSVCEDERLFEPIRLPYTKIEDCSKIIKDNKLKISYWFFTGHLPYYYCLSEGLINKENSVYPQDSGEGLMSTLFKIYKTNREISSIGFDVFPPTVIEETLDSLDLNLEFYDSVGVQIYSDIDKALKQHLYNLSEKKVDVIITSLSRVEKVLKEKSLPVYKVALSKTVVRKACMEIFQIIKTKSFQLSSIVIMAVELEFQEEKKLSPSHSFKKKQTQIDYYLLDLAEKVNGILSTYSESTHLIITTNGELDEFLAKYNLYDFLDNLEILHGVSAYIGIGYGLNVQLASRNVYKSIKASKNAGKCGIFKVQEDGTLYGPLNNNNIKSKKVSSDNNTIERVIALSNQYGIKEITASGLSSWLKVTERNARRILTEMESRNLVKQKKKETGAGKRGRPRKIYKITL